MPAKGQTRWWWYKKGDRRVCSNYRGYHATQPSWESLLKGIGKEVSAICQNSDTETAVWFLHWPWMMDHLFTFSCLWGSTGSGGGLWSPGGFCGGRCGNMGFLACCHGPFDPCMTAMRANLIIKSSVGCWTPPKLSSLSDVDLAWTGPRCSRHIHLGIFLMAESCGHVGRVANMTLAAACAATGKIISSVQQIVLPLPCKADGQKYVYNRDSLLGIRDCCRNGPLGDLNWLSEHGLLCQYRGNQGTDLAIYISNS